MRRAASNCYGGRHYAEHDDPAWLKRLAQDSLLDVSAYGVCSSSLHEIQAAKSGCTEQDGKIDSCGFAFRSRGIRLLTVTLTVLCARGRGTNAVELMCGSREGDHL